MQRQRAFNLARRFYIASIFLAGMAAGVVFAAVLMMPAPDSIKVLGGAAAGVLLAAVVFFLVVYYDR